MSDVPPTTAESVDIKTGQTIPEGCAVITSMGWSEDEPSEFTAMLRFPNGPPRIPMRMVFDSVPIQLVPMEPGT